MPHEARVKLRDVTIETERLRLRPIAAGDVEALVRLHGDPEVARFIRPLARAQAQERVALAEREWRERGCGMLAVLARDDGRFLGRTGLRYWPQFDETEIGWALRREEWGRGYATEAARACLAWACASLTVPYLTAMINPDNHASARLARRLGMAPLREDVLLGDPVVVYGIDCAAERGSGSGEQQPGR